MKFEAVAGFRHHQIERDTAGNGMLFLDSHDGVGGK